VLGVAPRLGRIFRPEEFRPGAAAVAIISTSLWQQRFGADPAVLGRKEILDGVSHTIIGVMPVSFQFPERRYIWAPKIMSEEDKRDRASTYLGVVGRLRPGVTIQAARDDMSRIARELAATYPSTNAKVGVQVASAPDELLGSVRPALLVLLGAVFCVLLVACANVANLLLARGSDRRREFAIRAALGAGRTRLARQMITESAVLAALGCAVGLVLGKWGITLLLALTPATLAAHRRDRARWPRAAVHACCNAGHGAALRSGARPYVLASRPSRCRSRGRTGHLGVPWTTAPARRADRVGDRARARAARRLGAADSELHEPRARRSRLLPSEPGDGAGLSL
jgi:hypothetical protein